MSAEATHPPPASVSTLHPARRQQILHILARHMATLNAYESKNNPSDSERAIRKEETKTTKLKILEVSKLMYDWAELDEGPRRLVIDMVERTLETVEEEVGRVV